MKVAALLVGMLVVVSAAAERVDLRFLGAQGDHHFFSVPKSHSADQAYLLNVAQGFCSRKRYCYLHFWEAGTVSARRLPMTDAQSKAEIATYTSNANTGKREMLWRCSKFKNAKPSQCFN